MADLKSSALIPRPARPDASSRTWVLALLAVAVGAGLVLTTWFGYAAVQEASASMIRGEGEALMRDLRPELRDLPERPPSSERLQELLERQSGEDAELHYVAVIDPVSGRYSEAGESRIGAERVRAQATASGNLRIEGDQALLVRRLPPNKEQRTRQRAEHPDKLIPPGQLNHIVIEYTPHAAHELEATAVRSLAAGAAATLVLLLTCLAFARVLVQRAALERDLARERQLAALGEMSAVLAHELRNPLASLKGHAQLLVEALPEDGREGKKAERVVSEAVRLEELCTQLLDFVRCGEVNPVATDVKAMLQACAESFPESRIDLSLDGAPSTWQLDQVRMQQVVTNLLRNAVEASPPEESVQVEARADNGTLAIAVRDQGEGLPPGEEERIFEPFHTTRLRGTGLGLAVARRVVELHGGTIAARSRPQGGTELQVQLPAEVG